MNDSTDHTENSTTSDAPIDPQDLKIGYIGG